MTTSTPPVEPEHEPTEDGVASQAFLKAFYKAMGVWFLIGLLPSFLVSDLPGLVGFVTGFICIAVIVGLWDFSLRFMLRARKASTVAETLMVFLRYGLLGGLFYAIMRLFVVSWPWYFAGSAIILPALLSTVVMFKGDDNTQNE